MRREGGRGGSGMEEKNGKSGEAEKNKREGGGRGKG